MRLLLLPLLVALATPALADERFTIVEQGERVIRVDRDSGAVDYCTRAGETLTCKLAPQERAAWEAETAALAARIDTLERRLAALDGKAVTKPDAATNDEIDDALAKAERFITGFFGIVERLTGNAPSNTN